MKDHRHHDITGANAPALDAYEKAIASFQTYTGDPFAHLDAALAAAPGFAMARVLKAQLLLTGTDAAGAAAAREVLGQVTGPVTLRERGHILAAESLARGDFEQACERFEDILVDHPLDLPALQMAHLYDLYRGDSKSLRDRPARVLPAWSRAVPGFHAVLGMHAFGLEETGNYAAAEARAREALALEPRDAWAHHAAAHVYEMQGRPEEGLAWMESREAHWSTDSFMAVHNWWHRALFLLELDDIPGVLSLYDHRIAPGKVVSLDLIDRSALLWRLTLRGVDVGQRWNALATDWLAAHPDDDFLVFNATHVLMALAAAGREADVAHQFSLLDARQQRPGSNREIIRDVGFAVARAVVDFARGRYAECVAGLRLRRHLTQRFGGSHAQRDVIDLTLLEAARRDGQKNLVRALAAERMALKPASALPRRYLEAA